MQKKLLFLLVLLFAGYHFLTAQSESANSQNVVLISLDGLRWQEVFGGIDSALLHEKEFTPNPEALAAKFWADTPEARREKLMPFFWNTIAKQGQLYGNRWKGNKVDCSNKMWFSYPGYNEILSGFADDERINSNDKINNPNETVLEFINGQPGFRNRVAAFGSWDVFPYIINAERSGIPVNAGFPQQPEGDVSEKEALLYKLQEQIPEEWGTVRYDAFTHHFALEYLERKHPRLLYISYGETDDFAHDGVYDEYIKSAYQTDAFIAELWDFVQKDPVYAGNTTFIITTDHGRGTQPLETWKHHGDKIPDAGEIWIAAFGANVSALGEVSNNQQLYQSQVAKTVATLLGLHYTNKKKVGDAISGVVGSR